MINRFYLKKLFSFQEIELTFKKGLIVISGPSGAGKSILINTILSTFGYSNTEAKLAEVTFLKSDKLNNKSYDFNEEITIKTIKKDKVRYYIDNQNISKKHLFNLVSPFIQYLSVRDKFNFDSNMIISILDNSLSKKNIEYKNILIKYKMEYDNYILKYKELENIINNQSKINELYDFNKFEIKKIDSLKLKVGEDTKLLKKKYQLSYIDKMTEAIKKAEEIFDYEESVNEVYRMLDKDNTFFVNSFNQMRDDFENLNSLSEELSEENIEDILNRLESISAIKNRYGSIEKAINYSQEKKIEIKKYESLKEDQSHLESFIKSESIKLNKKFEYLLKYRKEEAKIFEKELSIYLNRLKLPNIHFIFSDIIITNIKKSLMDIDLDGSSLSTLSGGETNRLRLALMVTALSNKKNKSIKSKNILILDEIDANVSGDESIAIADIISKLSLSYQIFAISHQPHLAAKADQHLLVTKINRESKVTILDKNQKIKEIARIIGGVEYNKEAINFAKEILK